MKDKRLLGGALLALLIIMGVVAKFVFFRHPFLYAGTIEATKVDVAARVSSVIDRLLVNEGNSVEGNQTLLTLACEDYRNSATLAKENFDRTDHLYRQGSQPKEAFDQAQYRWNDAHLKLDWCTVASPLAGTVLSKYHEPGEQVEPGTRLFTLANLKEPYAYIYVPQPKIARLSLGQKVVGYLPELDMKAFDGTIVQIGNEAEFTPKNVQTRDERTRLIFAVKIQFDNPQRVLKPGMFIEVKLPES